MQLSPKCIHIDGSNGEGGGQILRNGISLACILQKELYIHNIRAGRSKPGLKAQHVTGLQLAARVCGGSLEGASKDSMEIHYQPPSEDSKTIAHTATFTGDTGTAGSICLLLQAVLPCALLNTRSSLATLILKGGTNADMAPQYDYWELVLLPILERFGLSSDQIQASVVRRGFFPRGGGEVHVQVKACRTELLPISLTDRGEVKEIYIRSFHAGTLGRHLAVQMASACKAFLKPRVHSTINWNEEIVTESSAIGNGLGLLVTAKTSTGCILAGSTLCKPKQTAKDAGEAAANELWEALSAGGCVDQWLQDQLIVFMALANGESEMLTGSLTLHTQTAITVAEELTNAKFIVERLSDDAERPAPRRGSKKYNESGCIHGQHLVRCKGQGFSPFGFSKRVDSKLL